MGFHLLTKIYLYRNGVTPKKEFTFVRTIVVIT